MTLCLAVAWRQWSSNGMFLLHRVHLYSIAKISERIVMSDSTPRIVSLCFVFVMMCRRCRDEFALEKTVLLHVVLCILCRTIQSYTRLYIATNRWLGGMSYYVVWRYPQWHFAVVHEFLFNRVIYDRCVARYNIMWIIGQWLHEAILFNHGWFVFRAGPTWYRPLKRTYRDACSKWQTTCVKQFFASIM